MSRTSLLLCACLGLAACNSARSQPSAAASAASAVPPVAQARVAAANPPPSTSDYVPAEFKAGAARWKDTGVYLDGKPIGFLTFGELPITLKPTWIKDKVSANKRPGTSDPSWRWAESRSYKFTDYLRALGLDPAKVRELHVYGPKPSDSIVVTGRDLMSARSAGFRFRFGSGASGKAIPEEPLNFGNGRTPDKIS